MGQPMLLWESHVLPAIDERAGGMHQSPTPKLYKATRPTRRSSRPEFRAALLGSRATGRTGLRWARSLGARRAASFSLRYSQTSPNFNRSLRTSASWTSPTPRTWHCNGLLINKSGFLFAMRLRQSMTQMGKKVLSWCRMGSRTLGSRDQMATTTRRGSRPWMTTSS